MKDSLADALNHLPHGPEFRFIDRMLSLNPGKTGEAEYVVKHDDPFLRGHFPGDPLFPGVLLAEAVAQLSGIVAQSDPDLAPMEGLKLTALRNVKILGSARPGETLLVRAEVTGRLGNLVQARGSVELEGKLLIQAELVLAGDAR